MLRIQIENLYGIQVVEYELFHPVRSRSFGFEATASAVDHDCTGVFGRSEVEAVD